MKNKKMLDNINTRRLIGAFVFFAIAFCADHLSSICNKSSEADLFLLIEMSFGLVAIGLLVLVAIEDKK